MRKYKEMNTARSITISILFTALTFYNVEAFAVQPNATTIVWANQILGFAFDFIKIVGIISMVMILLDTFGQIQISNVTQKIFAVLFALGALVFAAEVVNILLPNTLGSGLIWNG